MADKQQNILIKYDFDTSAVERAAAVLGKANQASNTLQSNAKNAGATINQSFTSGTRSIISMEVELQRLKTLIGVATDPKKIQELSSQYKRLAADIKKANTEAFGTTTKSVKETTSAYGGLISAAKAFITIGLVKEVFNISLEMATLAGKVEGVEKAFANAIPNATSLLADLRKATHGTQTDLDLMQRTLQAKNLGIPVQELGTFFEFAAIRAQQTGVSIDYLTDSIVNGLGRKSTRVLDNLGISASRIKDQFEGVSLEQLSVAEVSQGVGSIIREEMQKMGDYVETSATKVEQFKVTWQELRQELAKFVTGNNILGNSFQALGEHIQGIIESFKLGIEATNKNTTVTELSNQKRVEEIALISEQVFARNALNKSQEENVKTIEDEIQRLTEELGGFARLRGVYQGRIDAINKERDAIHEKRFESQKEAAQFRETIALNAKLRDAHQDDIAIDQEILKLLQARLQAMKEVDDQEVESTGIIERKKKQIEELNKAIEKTNKASDLTQITVDKDGNATMQVGRLIKQLEIAQAELADLQRAFTDIDIKPLSLKLGQATKDLEKLAGAAGTLTFDPKKNFEKSLKDRAQRAQSSIQLIENGLSQLAEFKPPPLTVAPKVTFWDDLKQEFEDNWRELTVMGIDILAGIGKSMVAADTAQLNQRLQLTEDFYRKQEQLAGDNANARTQIERSHAKASNAIRNELAEKEKKARVSQAIIDGAAGVAKAFATYAWPYSLIVSGFIAAETAAQVSVIRRQPAQFAKGKINIQGPGTATSDSIPAMLSKGESVMTAEQTFRARHVLEEVRARKLDDRTLKQLRQGRSAVNVQTQKFDASEVVDAVRENTNVTKQNRPVDLVRHGSLLMEARKHSETLTRKVRSKSVNL